jgi:hypothetical protein
VAAAVASSPYPVRVLPVDAERAAACGAALGVSTRSWLGAVVAGAGGQAGPLAELVDLYQDAARQLGGSSSDG